MKLLIKLSIALLALCLTSCSISLSEVDRENMETFGNEIHTLNENLGVVNDLNTNLVQLSGDLCQIGNLRSSLANLSIVLNELNESTDGEEIEEKLAIIARELERITLFLDDNESDMQVTLRALSSYLEAELNRNGYEDEGE